MRRTPTAAMAVASFVLLSASFAAQSETTGSIAAPATPAPIYPVAFEIDTLRSP